MEKLLIVNGSPRAPRSNSKRYAQMFQDLWQKETDVYEVTEKQHQKICRSIGDYDHLLFVFPLYVDSLPAVLINFLKELERAVRSCGQEPLKLRVHTIINCGFLEPEQNDAAVDMLHYFCERNHLKVGMTLVIASGEAILTTPFASGVNRKMRQFVKEIAAGESRRLNVTMPLPKWIFVRASENYWKEYGKKFHTAEEEMKTMRIEGK